MACIYIMHYYRFFSLPTNQFRIHLPEFEGVLAGTGYRPLLVNDQVD